MGVSAVIDALEFARKASVWSADVPLAAFARLADVLDTRAGSEPGHLQCALQGMRQGKQLLLDLAVSGVLPVRCQRCLAPMDWPLAISRRLFLVPPGAPWPEQDDAAEESIEAIEAPPAQPVLDLLEDEILLALPISMRHEHCSEPVILVNKE